MRKKALLAAGIMLSLISLIAGALLAMLRLVTVSTRGASEPKDSSSPAGWLSLLGFALGLSLAIYAARMPKATPEK